MEKMIQTVNGPVSSSKLGHTWMHEHIFCSSMGVANIYPQLYRKDYMEHACQEMSDMMAGGISTVVEATGVALGRDVRSLKKVSEKTGLNIIATTGWWGARPPYMGPTTDEMWAQCFIDDLTKGCEGTDIKAGILKASMDIGDNIEWDKQVHHAIAMASQETGANMYLHTYPPKGTPVHQLNWLKEAGADLTKVAVDHIPEGTDIELVKWIYDQGAWLGIDRLPCIVFPGEYPTGLKARIDFIKKMLDAGMGDRMLFSHDITSVTSLFDNQTPEMYKYLNDQTPDRFLFIKKHVFPALADMGVDPDYLWNLTEENPRRFFEGE